MVMSFITINNPYEPKLTYLTVKKSKWYLLPKTVRARRMNQYLIHLDSLALSYPIVFGNESYKKS